jgi:DNA-binding NarL/FixJ family response regulator
VVGGAVDAEEAILLVSTRRADVLFLDLSMPGLGGLAALPRLRAAALRTRIVVLSASSAVVYAQGGRNWHKQLS